MTWTPSDALVEKAARAMWSLVSGVIPSWEELRDHDKQPLLDDARAALIACRDDLVAEAVRAERDRVLAEMFNGCPWDNPGDKRQDIEPETPCPVCGDLGTFDASISNCVSRPRARHA